ncbi:Serine/threonine-protein phosphatase 2B catalytic subunit alpha, variant 2, partial [Bonamia ostreae]
MQNKLQNLKKVTDILETVINLTTNAEKKTAFISERKQILKDKITAISSILAIYKNLRSENEVVLKTKQLSPNSNRKMSDISNVGSGILNISSFEDAKIADS